METAVAHGLLHQRIPSRRQRHPSRETAIRNLQAMYDVLLSKRRQGLDGLDQQRVVFKPTDNRSGLIPGSATTISIPAADSTRSMGGSHTAWFAAAFRLKNCRCRRSARRNISNASAHIHVELR